MKKLFVLLSVSLFMLAACCNSPKNTDDATTKAEAVCCADCDDTKAEGACAEECKECPDTKKECPDTKKECADKKCCADKKECAEVKK